MNPLKKLAKKKKSTEQALQAFGRRMTRRVLLNQEQHRQDWKAGKVPYYSSAKAFRPHPGETDEGWKNQTLIKRKKK